MTLPPGQGTRHAACFYIWMVIVARLLTANNLSLFFMSWRHHRLNTVNLGEIRILFESCDLSRSFLWPEMSICQFYEEEKTTMQLILRLGPGMVTRQACIYRLSLPLILQPQTMWASPWCHGVTIGLIEPLWEKPHNFSLNFWPFTMF